MDNHTKMLLRAMFAVAILVSCGPVTLGQQVTDIEVSYLDAAALDEKPFTSSPSKPANQQSSPELSQVALEQIQVSPEPIQVAPEPIQVVTEPIVASLQSVPNQAVLPIGDGTCQSCNTAPSCAPTGVCVEGCQCDHCRHRPIRNLYRCYKRNLLGDPDRFCERPFGSYSNNAMMLQTLAGTSQRMMLYQYDFHDGKHGDPIVSLKPRGRIELARIAGMMRTNGLPLMIEASRNNPDLDQLRQQQVLVDLQELGVDVSPHAVVVLRPDTRGLSGTEAILHYGGMLRRAMPGTSGGGGGGIGGGGIGGGGIGGGGIGGGGIGGGSSGGGFGGGSSSGGLGF